MSDTFLSCACCPTYSVCLVREHQYQWKCPKTMRKKSYANKYIIMYTLKILSFFNTTACIHTVKLICMFKYMDDVRKLCICKWDFMQAMTKTYLHSHRNTLWIIWQIYYTPTVFLSQTGTSVWNQVKWLKKKVFFYCSTFFHLK